MVKKHFKLLIITSLVILLPILAGVLLWDQLPEQMPIHWNAAGEVDGWSSKLFAVVYMPMILVALQWVCVLATASDPRKKNHGEKILHLVFWLIPVLSVVLFSVTYLSAMSVAVKMDRIMPVLMGLMFTMIGNYLPKCKQNYTIGIKIPWTLNNEENWNKTHRLAGWVWVVCGVAMMCTGFVGGFMVFFPITLLMIVIPMVYSYILHRKGL